MADGRAENSRVPLSPDLANRLDAELRNGANARLVVETLKDAEHRPAVLDHLALRAGSGSRFAMAALLDAVQEYDIAGPALRRLLVDRDDVDDVRQDVLIAMTRSIHSFEGRARFTTWLEAIARNTAISFLRRRRDEHSLSGNELTQGQRLSSMIASRGTLQDALADLPDKYRLPVVMRDIHQLPYDEIAGKLELNLNTTKSRIARGRALLAAGLDASFDKTPEEQT